MANVVVIHYGGVKVEGKYKTFIFYEGLIGALQKNGNDVMEIITNDFLRRPWGGSNDLNWGIKRSKLIRDIVAFNPDLVISFNNSSIDGLEEVVSCPIAVWSADHFYHFNDLEKLKASKDRFIYFCAQSGDIADCQKIIGASPDRCFRVKPATSIRPDLNRKKTNNIVFIGSPFGNYEEKDKLYRYKKEYVELVKKLIRKEGNEKELAHRYRKIRNVKQTILDFGSVANRTNVLSHVAPLGMKIHGGEGWLDVGLDSSLDIFNAYDPKQVYSIAQTEDAYDSSKIGININHSQAKTGFSWRVMDILASSAVLVSNHSADLEEELGDLSRELIYHSPQEAYEICLKLIKDDALREKIVERSNEIVNKSHTWEIRICEIEKIVGIKLVNKKSTEGACLLLEAKNYRTMLSSATFSLGINQDFVMGCIIFILPYGIVKIMRNKEERNMLLDVRNYRKLSLFGHENTNKNPMRIIRFMSPHGIVSLIRRLKDKII